MKLNYKTKTKKKPRIKITNQKNEDWYLNIPDKRDHLEIWIVRVEREKKGKKNCSAWNPFRNIEHALLIKKKDVVKNLMTQHKTIFHHQRMLYALSKHDGTL
jgi:hypothetical protein